MAIMKPALSPTSPKELNTAKKGQLYAKEKSSWVEAAAFARVEKSLVPEQSYIIGSHIV